MIVIVELKCIIAIMFLHQTRLNHHSLPEVLVVPKVDCFTDCLRISCFQNLE